MSATVIHASITEARMYYALRRAGKPTLLASTQARYYAAVGCNLRGLQALLRGAA